MKYNKQKHIFLFLIGLITVTLFSCEKKEIEYGVPFVDNSYTQIYEIDTITPAISTIYIDSFVTSNSGFGLIGNTVDPSFGTLKSSAYFQLGIPTYDATGKTYQNLRFDSLTIFFKLRRGTWYGDTSKPIKLNVFRLTQNIYPPITGTGIFNNTTYPTESAPFASQSFMIHPTTADSIFDTLSLRLPDTLGLSLLKKLQTADFSIQTQNQFLTYFKGIKIAADPSSNLSIAIADSIQMRIYYTAPGIPSAPSAFISFPMNNSANQFNNISIERTGVLAGKEISRQNNIISSTLTDSSGYLLPLGSTLVKITFPTLNVIVQQYFLRILKATLIIRPIPNSYSYGGVFGLPPSLQLIPTDINNGYTGAPITGAAGSTAASYPGAPTSAAGASNVQTGNLLLSYSDPAFTGPYYSYDLTAQLQSLATNPGANTQQLGLLLAPSSSGLFTSYNRLIFGDGRNANARMQLQIQYLSIK